MKTPSFLRIYFYLGQRLPGAVASFGDAAIHEWTLDLANNRIVEFPLKEKAGLGQVCIKVVDTGVYACLDDDMKPWCGAVSGYVPAFFPEAHFGDYIELAIKRGGYVENWTAKPEEVGRACAALSALARGDRAFEAFVLQRRAPELWEQVKADPCRVTVAYHPFQHVQRFSAFLEDYDVFTTQNAKT